MFSYYRMCSLTDGGAVRAQEARGVLDCRMCSLTIECVFLQMEGLSGLKRLAVFWNKIAVLPSISAMTGVRFPNDCSLKTVP